MLANTTIEENAAATLKRLGGKDRALKPLLKKAYAYAIFPSVGKAALVIGGSYGRGIVFERGKFIGHATISQLTIGVQIGGETFSEILVFENKDALDRLRKGKMAFAANASAVLMKAGAMGSKDFTNGVAVYAYSKGGMLLEAVIGGQKFNFESAANMEQAARNARAANGKSAKRKSPTSGGGEKGKSGVLTRVRSAIGGAGDGVKTAASRVGAAAKAHPVIATVAGTAVTAGVAMLVMRSVRGAKGVANPQASESGEQSSANRNHGGDDQSEEKGDTLNNLRRRRSRRERLRPHLTNNRFPQSGRVQGVGAGKKVVSDEAVAHRKEVPTRQETRQGAPPAVTRSSPRRSAS